MRIILLTTAVVLVSITGATSQAFTFELMNTNIDELLGAHVAFGDVDRDGEMDLLVNGRLAGEFPIPITRAYIGEREEQRVPPGGGMPRWYRDFVEVGRGISPVWLGSVRWLDVNHINRLEALVIGGRNNERPFEPAVGLYNFAGSQWSNIPTPMPGLLGGSIDVGDFDNDGDEDVLLTGSSEDNSHHTYLFRGTTGNEFANSGIQLPGVGMGDGTFVDFDSDGDLDIFLIGDTDEGFGAFLMRNDGAQFTEVPTDIQPLGFASTSWADYDNDGDLDLAVSGGTLSGLLINPEARIYRNDGNGVFTDIGADLVGSYYGTVKWGDFDNDGDPDLLEVGGGFVDDRRVGLIHENFGGTFRLGVNLIGIGISSSDIGDYDGDGDLDVIELGDRRKALFRNNRYVSSVPFPVPNGQPDPPDGLASDVNGSDVVLSWNPGSDDRTPEAGLTYNIRIGTAPLAIDIVTPTANPSTGRRLFSKLGNVQNNRSWTVRGLPSGTYYWSVQTLDATYNWSAFAEEARFTVE